MENKGVEDDPFSCFDSSDDDEHYAERDPENGVLSFHSGTEVALLHHVKTKLVQTVSDNDCGDGVMRTIKMAEKLLRIIDSYCLHRHWMMIIGPEKSNLLRTFIVDCLQKKKEDRDNNNTGRREDYDNAPVNIVELGTYCGYSSIFIAKTILEYYCNDDDQSTTTTVTEIMDTLRFQIYSVEVVEQYSLVAKEMIRLAGIDAYVKIITIDPEASSLSSELRTNAAATMNEDRGIDFLFIDHDKSLYLPDLKELEATGMIKKGTHVAADNVVFAEIQDYRRYMSKLSDEGILTTRLENSLVEFCQPELLLSSLDGSNGSEKNNNIDDDNLSTISAALITKDLLQDGIEFSVYLRDPKQKHQR